MKIHLKIVELEGFRFFPARRLALSVAIQPTKGLSEEELESAVDSCRKQARRQLDEEEFEIDPAAVLNGLVLDSRGDAVNNALVRIAPYVDPSKNEGRRNWRSRRQRMVKSVEARSAATGRFSVDEITVGVSACAGGVRVAFGGPPPPHMITRGLSR